MRLSLPNGHAFNIRKVTTGVRKIVTSAVGSAWQGGRLTVQIADSVHIPITASGQPRVIMLRLSDAWPSSPETIELAPREGARTAERRTAIRGVSGLIEPGHGVLALRFSGPSRDVNTATPMLYLHTVTSDVVKQATLGVARDAFLAGDRELAKKMVVKTIPLMFALFMLLLEQEASYLAHAQCVGEVTS